MIISTLCYCWSSYCVSCATIKNIGVPLSQDSNSVFPNQNSTQISGNQNRTELQKLQNQTTDKSLDNRFGFNYQKAGAYGVGEYYN